MATDPQFVVNTVAGKLYTPKMLNINGSDDLFYRYKVPQLLTQVVGKGKMIKTMLLNIHDVATSLKTLPNYIGAFLGYEIGAQFKHDPKKSDPRERMSISGEYPPAALTTVLQKFIKQVVLCEKCNLPEINMTLKDKIIWFNCASCGNRYRFKQASEKFAKYIQNNPPPIKNFKKGTQKAAPKKDGEKKDGEKRVRKVVSETKSGNDTDVVWHTDTSEAAVALRREAMVPTSVKKIVDEAEAASKVEGEEEDEAKLVTLKDILESPNHTADDIIQELEKLHLNHVDPVSTVEVVFSSICPQSDTSGAALLGLGRGHAKLLKKLIVNENTQVALLESIEEWLKANDSLAPKIPHILKGLYDADIVEEGAILAWTTSEPISATVRKHAEPFANWLREAEEEDSDEE